MEDSIPRFVPEPIKLEGYNYQRFLVFIPPEEFLRIAYNQIKNDYISKGKSIPTEFDSPNRFPRSPNLPKIKRAIRNFEPIPAPFLIVEDSAVPDITSPHPHRIVPTGKGYVSGHEGRNRSLAATEESITEIPVIIEMVGLKNWNEFQRIRHDRITMEKVLQNVGINNYRVSEENFQQ